MTSNTDNTDNNNTTAKYIPLIDHDDYEILNEYPFTIRRKIHMKLVNSRMV